MQCKIIAKIFYDLPKIINQISQNKEDMQGGPLDPSAVFFQHDADADGLVNADELVAIFKALGMNIYKGTINKIIRLMNVGKADKLVLNCQQFLQYYQNVKIKPKYDAWKAKIELQKFIFSVREKATAAPSNMLKQHNQKGNIDILVGPKFEQYPTTLELAIQKIPKEQSKPFIKIMLETSSTENAHKLKQAINTLYKTLIDLLKSQQPEYETAFDQIHLIATVNGKIVTLFVTTSNSDWVEILNAYSQFFDRALGQQVSGKLELLIGCDVNVDKFIQDQEYIYTFLTKDCHIKAKWEGDKFMSAIKQTLMYNQIFSNLQSSKNQPAQLSLIGLLSTESYNVKLQFDNCSEVFQDQQLKNEMMDGLKQITQSLNQVFGGCMESYEHLTTLVTGRIIIEASIGNWKVNLKLKIANILKLLKIPGVQE